MPTASDYFRKLEELSPIEGIGPGLTGTVQVDLPDARGSKWCVWLLEDELHVAHGTVNTPDCSVRAPSDGLAKVIASGHEVRGELAALKATGKLHTQGDADLFERLVAVAARKFAES